MNIYIYKCNYYYNFIIYEETQYYISCNINAKI